PTTSCAAAPSKYDEHRATTAYRPADQRSISHLLRVDRSLRTGSELPSITLRDSYWWLDRTTKFARRGPCLAERTRGGPPGSSVSSRRSRRQGNAGVVRRTYT